VILAEIAQGSRTVRLETILGVFLELLRDDEQPLDQPDVTHGDFAPHCAAAGRAMAPRRADSPEVTSPAEDSPTAAMPSFIPRESVYGCHIFS
jgi:hypothetical protein